MGDQAVTSLYRKVVSPSVKFKTEGLQKETHARHVQYRGRSPLALRHLAASPAIFVTQPSRSTFSAPGRVENRHTALMGSDNQTTAQENRGNQQGNYDFHPTTRFKTTSLPAMPMTSRYAAQSVNGTSRSIPLSTTRHSALSLPDKLQTSDINPRILFTSQKQRQLAESRAKDECRRLKRKSEIIAHRVDKHYYLCGNKIPVKHRWDVDANDLLRLKLLAHQKQLGQYQSLKESEADLCDPRDSPSGQLSSPTPADLLSGQQSPRESEGKWAEDTKSETSSIDDIDHILAMKGRRTRLPESSTNQRTTDTPTGNEMADKELPEKEEETCQENTEQEISVADIDNVPDKVKNNNTVEDEKEKKNIKPTSSKTSKKIKNLRFQDEVTKKQPSNQRRVKSGNPKDNDNESKKEEQKNDDHVNPYMDEWLGVKKKEVDGRYKPGKPPPNRIFISSEISKSKIAQVAKFSDAFLTETITLHENQMKQNTDDVTPETIYGIIGEKQKGAFKEMFNEVDKDKNGSVTLEELKLKMMPSVSRDDIKNFVQVFDLNKDKTVDCREFTAICCLNDRLAGTRTETSDGSIALDLEKLAQHIVIFKEMYKTMDEDDDNRLDCDEVLVMVSAAMGTEMGTDLADARRVLSAARDEFGYIDFVGFMSYIPFFAKLLQAIMKNPLSINDIEKARERVKQKELTFKPKKVTKKEPKSWEAY